MVEPTESEDKAELDRFVEAMVTIRGEIEKVATGEYDRTDNPLRNAPHTLAMLAGEWERPYPRTTAVYPVRGLQGRMYLSPVRRIDQAYGDRNLVCACPPPEAFAEHDFGDARAVGERRDAGAVGRGTGRPGDDGRRGGRLGLSRRGRRGNPVDAVVPACDGVARDR